MRQVLVIPNQCSDEKHSYTGVHGRVEVIELEISTVGSETVIERVKSRYVSHENLKNITGRRSRIVTVEVLIMHNVGYDKSPCIMSVAI
jgi:hypothetical protein